MGDSNPRPEGENLGSWPLDEWVEARAIDWSRTSCDLVTKEAPHRRGLDGERRGSTELWLGLLRAAARTGFEPANVRLTAGCLWPLGYRAIVSPITTARWASGRDRRTCRRESTACRPRGGFRSCRVFKEPSRRMGGFPGNRTLPCRLRAGCSALELETPVSSRSSC